MLSLLKYLAYLSKNKDQLLEAIEKYGLENYIVSYLVERIDEILFKFKLDKIRENSKFVLHSC
jgi:hypothetical protein